MGKNQSLTGPYPLILASTSKYRGALLAQLGWDFEAMAPGVDEDQFKNKNLSPEKLAMLLSQEKALAVFKKRNDSCVIGSDQVCSLGSDILSKPHTSENAVKQLLSMQGKTHELLTAVTICSPQGTKSFINKTVLHMRSMNEKEISDYVSADLPLDCAGSYKLESRGIKLFSRIEMSDHTAIIGLPLIELTSSLLELGYQL